MSLLNQFKSQLETVKLVSENRVENLINLKSTPKEIIDRLMQELTTTAEVADLAIDTLKEILQSLSENVMTEEGKFKRVFFNLGAYGKAAGDIKNSIEDFMSSLKEITNKND